MNYQQLRQKHPEFYYESYQYRLLDKNLVIKFNFILHPDLSFQPKVTIKNIDLKRWQKFPKDLLDNLIFHLGMAELPSYWKTACSPLITIKAGFLHREQQQWWLDLLQKGMGEFYYQNKIKFTDQDFVKLAANSDGSSLHPELKLPYSLPYLVPVGGGKDSSLLLGLLDKNQIQYGCLFLKPQSPAALAAAQLSHCQQKIVVKREIDPHLLQLNKKGYLNGHTPFSSYLSFLGVLTAHLFGYQQILTANESSANQPNLKYLNQTINHQYSKSFEYEQKFRSYSQKYLQSRFNNSGSQKKEAVQKTVSIDSASKAEYLSALRPLNELQIAALFTQFKRFYSVFKSCNLNQKQGTWCHACPKCLFVFTLLYPFVEEKVLVKNIFKKNLFKDKQLIQPALRMSDETRQKPFECVGTYLESRIAFYLSLKKYKQNQQETPVVLQAIEEQVLSRYSQNQLEKQAQKLLQNYNKQHHLDQKLAAILKKELC